MANKLSKLISKVSVGGLNLNSKDFAKLRNSLNAYRVARFQKVDDILNNSTDLALAKASLNNWNDKKARFELSHDISIVGGTADTEEKALAIIKAKIDKYTDEVEDINNTINALKEVQDDIIANELKTIPNTFVEKFLLLDKDPFNEVYVSDCINEIAKFFNGFIVNDEFSEITFSDAEKIFDKLVGVNSEKSNKNIRKNERLTKVSIGNKPKVIKETFYSFLIDFVFIDFMNDIKWKSKIVEKAKKKADEKANDDKKSDDKPIDEKANDDKKNK